MSGELAIILAALLLLAAVAAAVLTVRTRRVVATPTERAVHTALHTASLAARALRQGLYTESAEGAAPFLRMLTGTVTHGFRRVNAVCTGYVTCISSSFSS